VQGTRNQYIRIEAEEKWVLCSLVKVSSTRGFGIQDLVRKINFFLDIIGLRWYKKYEDDIRRISKHQGWVISLFPLSLRSQPCFFMRIQGFKGPF
jgi:hypothetical protein